MTGRASPTPPLSFLPGGGEMGQRIRAFDWSRTPLGPAANWPQSLKTAVRIILSSRYPMFLWWGPNRINLYNDAYIPILGKRHPQALGRYAADVWADIWPVVGPQADIVLQEGRATWNEEALLLMERNQFLEETYFTFSYSPLPDDEGGIGGVFCACTEETQQVLSQRRLRTLRELAERATQARTAGDACQIAATTLAENPHDLPFALLYLLGNDGRRAQLAGCAGLKLESPAAPAEVELDDLNAAWPLRQVAETGKAIVLHDLIGRFGPLPGGAWPESPQQAILLPMTRPGQSQPAGFIVAGLSPRLAFNDDYRTFMELLAGQVATTIANARAYEEARWRAEQLAEIDRAKTAFFSNVSHEFRTPLTLMLGPVEDMLAQAGLPPAAQNQLEVVHRNSLRLLQLVNTLLDFSRLEAGRLQARYEPVDLAHYTAELASLFRAAIERAGLRLIVHCPPLPEPVYVDRDMWEKIVLNLLSNAFKFTFSGEIEVRLAASGGQAHLLVRDTGVGVPAEELSQIFERFHRVKETRGRTYEGSGIGLALVQELVRLHGGSVQAESALNEGSRFIVTLPLGHAHLDPQRIVGRSELLPATTGADIYIQEALRWLPPAALAGQAERLLQSPAETPYTPPPSSSTASEPARILWADDNADMRDYVSRLLGQRYQVEAVADGQAALDAARANPPTVILSDIMMPRLDGFGLLRALRQEPALQHVPIILLSARAGEEARVEGIERGADDYLVKPFSARELLARVDSQVRLARLRVQLTAELAERKRAEQALRESEARFRMMADTAPAMLWITDLNNEATFLSRGWYEYTGQTETEALGFGWTEAIHPDDRQTSTEQFQWAAERRQKFALDYRLRRADGSYRWAIDAGHPRFADSGDFLGYIGSVIDVHERKEAEEQLRRLNEELEQRVAERTQELAHRNQRLRQLANQLAEAEQSERRRLAKTLHDGLQQLLIAGKLQLRLLLNDGSAETAEDLKTLLDEAIELSRSLTYELSPPVLQTAGLPEALHWLARWFQNNYRFTVHLQVSEPFPTVPDDTKIFLFDAIRELLFNSVKHSAGTVATVELRQPHPQQLWITVTDDGQGFDPAAVEQDGRQRQGFGLFSIRERLTALGGDFHINATPGAGACFILTLPIPTAETPPLPSPA